MRNFLTGWEISESKYLVLFKNAKDCEKKKVCSAFLENIV